MTPVPDLDSHTCLSCQLLRWMRDITILCCFSRRDTALDATTRWIIHYTIVLLSHLFLLWMWDAYGTCNACLCPTQMVDSIINDTLQSSFTKHLGYTVPSVFLIFLLRSSAKGDDGSNHKLELLRRLGRVTYTFPRQIQPDRRSVEKGNVISQQGFHTLKSFLSGMCQVITRLI